MSIVNFEKLDKVMEGLWRKAKDLFVERWSDLEYTTQSNNFNIFNTSTFEDGEYYNSLGYLEKTPNWGNFKIPCSGGETFTVFKKTHDTINLGLMFNGSWVQNLVVNRVKDNGWEKYTFTIPQTRQFDHISIPVFKQHNDYKAGVMVFSGDVAAPNKYIPFTNNRKVSIDGANVAITFDPSNTTLTSGTTADAIKELDGKIINAGGGTVTKVNNVDPINGNVTINSTHINTTTSNQTVQQALDGKINTAEVGDDPNKIPRIGADGRLSPSIMPNLAITDVIVIPNGADIMNQTVQKGDVIVVQDEGNKTYMCKNEQGQNKNDKFIEINMGFPVVKEINGKNPAPTGAITINKTDIHGYKGNKILVYGDNFSFKDKWQTHVGTSLGATFFKLGGGTDPLCAVGTDTTNVPLCSVNKLDSLSRSIQDNNIDTVLVMAGFNDFDYDGTIKPSNQGVISLKNPNDEYSSTTISGAMATVIKHMMLNHKDVRLFVCTFPNIKHQGNSTQDNQSEYKNSANISVAEINKTIKETAEFYGVPCIDIYGLSGIGKLTRSAYLENATTLNEEGNKAVANVVVNELLRFNKNI